MTTIAAVAATLCEALSGKPTAEGDGALVEALLKREFPDYACSVTLGDGLAVHGSYEAVHRVQHYIMLPSKHPQEVEDGRRYLMRQLVEAEKHLGVLRDQVKQCETKIREQGAEIATLQQERTIVAPLPPVERIAPCQGRIAGIPWDLHCRAWDVYAAKFGRMQSAERIAERGGFGVKELDAWVPGWRDELDTRTKMAAHVAKLLDEAEQNSAEYMALLAEHNAVKAENERLSRAVASGVLQTTLDADETTTLVDFMRFLRETKPT